MIGAPAAPPESAVPTLSSVAAARAVVRSRTRERDERG